VIKGEKRHQNLLVLCGFENLHHNPISTNSSAEVFLETSLTIRNLAANSMSFGEDAILASYNDNNCT
jgi:hypothetical protein